MIVTAKFKGKDGSKGYKSGKRYRLNFNVVSVYATANSRIEIDDSQVSDWDKNTTVQYSSLKKFLDNWEVVTL